MSFREQRNFIEILRNLGYGQTISFDSFRQPNFVLVADILFFLVQRYDPNLRLSQDIETEQERVTFLKSIAEVMATKMRIKLNTKKLYGADGYAVKEMLKIASMLDQAIREAKKEDEIADSVPPLSTKVGEIRRCRQLATEITQQGAKLFDMLKKVRAGVASIGQCAIVLIVKTCGGRRRGTARSGSVWLARTWSWSWSPLSCARRSRR